MSLVKQNHTMFKQVLQKKVKEVDEIKKSKNMIKRPDDDSRKITKSFTIPTSARFDAIDMTVKY